MGAQIRAFDWAATPLGPISRWPMALRITVDQILASKFPACLFWGPELIAIYNDSYSPMLGTKPLALGQPLRVTWAEVWPQLASIAAKALAGESSFFEDYLIRVNRRGRLEDAWFTFNYGPVFDENGVIVGMLDTVVETTAQVLARRSEHAERDRLQRMLQQMPGFAAVLSGPAHVYEFVNDAYISIAGQRDFIGRTVKEVFPELDDQGFFDLLDQVYATGKPLRANAMALKLAPKNGELFIDLLYEPIRNASGAVEGIFVGGYDITDRMTAEARLRESEAQLLAMNADLERRVIERTLARGRAWEVSPEMLCVINADGFFEATNPAWQKALGWTEAEMARVGFRALVHPDDLASSTAAWADATERSLPVLHFENRYRTQAGHWRWLSWVAVPEDHKVYCITRDVTDEKARQAALAERTAERDIYATIFQTTDAFIQVLDLNFCFLAINDANAAEYQRIFGFRPRVGDSLAQLLEETSPQHKDAALAPWRRALSGESFVQQGEFGLTERGRRTYEMKFEALCAPDGRQIGAFHISTDITERLGEQRAMAAMQEALRHSQKMEALGQLTGGIAHDFNNLLAAISNSLQIMRKLVQSNRPHDPSRYLDIGERSVQRAAALTQRLLAFSRRQTLDPRPTDVNRLMQGMADLVTHTVGPAIQIVLQQAPDLWATHVDPSQLENALLNLCINARDAMPDGGTITLVTSNANVEGSAAITEKVKPGKYVCLRIIDTGVGMPPEVIERVFDPFFTTKPLGQGTGLGLSMVYGFVHQSGGHVGVDSIVGQGTTMSLYLPHHSGTVEEEPTPATSYARPDGRGETVLLVEDEEALRVTLREVLREAGYRVLVAENGAAGLHILESGAKISLLITDVGLPGGMNGRQLADAGRLLFPAMRVLFITGYADAAMAGTSDLRSSGMQIITKPFNLTSLVEKVQEMLG